METIKGYFQKETGCWSIGLDKYIDRKWSEVTEKDLGVELDTSNCGGAVVLRFIGGPTGHESYLLDALVENFKAKELAKFYICAGTINSWPSCWVLWSDLKPIVEKLVKEVI